MSKCVNQLIENISKLPITLFQKVFIIGGTLVLLLSLVVGWELLNKPVHPKANLEPVSLGQLLWKARLNKKLHE